jgi:hypothetical protein
MMKSPTSAIDEEKEDDEEEKRQEGHLKASQAIIRTTMPFVPSHSVAHDQDPKHCEKTSNQHSEWVGETIGRGEDLQHFQRSKE